MNIKVNNIMKSQPKYYQLFLDIIKTRNIDLEGKSIDLESINKNYVNALDVLNINNQLFDSKLSDRANAKHKSYDINTILKILKYQKKHNLNNTEIARKYSLSRNTVAKWKKDYKTRLF